MYMVTGCAGFIGSNLAERLLNDGYSVIGIDNLNSYYPISLKKENIKTLNQDSNFTFVNASILDRDLMNKHMKDVDIVFHQAAMAGVRNSILFPSKYFETNVQGTTNLLELASKSAEKFILASSSSVYGEVKKNELPVREDREPKPKSPYALSKLHSEKICEMFTNLYGLKTVCLRYFTVYGPRQRPDEAFTKFLIKAIRNEEVQIYGDGKQTRDFTFVDDVVNANILAGKCGKGIYNIGSDRSIKLNDVLGIMGSILGKKIRRIDVERNKADVLHTWADITKAKKELGYSPEVSISDGIMKHFKWCKKYENSNFGF